MKEIVIATGLVIAGLVVAAGLTDLLVPEAAAFSMTATTFVLLVCLVPAVWYIGATLELPTTPAFIAGWVVALVVLVGVLEWAGAEQLTILWSAIGLFVVANLGLWWWRRRRRPA